MENQIPDFKNVLVIGTSPTTTKIVEAFATNHPETQFEYITTFEIKNLNIPNVKIIPMELYYNISPFRIIEGNIPNVVTQAIKTSWIGFYGWLKSYITKNIESYDFIVCNYFNLQKIQWFQEFKKQVPIFCPDRLSHSLENDKLFTKQILIDAGIPTPKFKILDKKNLINEVYGMVDRQGLPIVLKADVAIHVGNAVTVFKQNNFNKEALTAYSNDLKLNLSQSDYNIFNEEFVEGREISMHFLCNGTEWKYLGSARDYKKEFDGDIGRNTSGAGCYSPVEYLTDNMKEKIFSYMDNLMFHLNMLGIYFNGVMYLGMIIDKTNTPQVLEINTRPGNPEFISIMDTFDTSTLLENFYRAATGMPLLDVVYRKNIHSVCVGMLHRQYSNFPRLQARHPTIPESTITNLKFYRQCSILSYQNLYGFISCVDIDRKNAAERIYNFLSNINMNDYRYRTDIGFYE
jgi:phosphoribosylamine--glycine ligase